jgi:hypothetical protein
MQQQYANNVKRDKKRVKIRSMLILDLSLHKNYPNLNQGLISQQIRMANFPADEERFHIDLEFVQNLVNPRYLNYLAQNHYFEEQEFLNYLKYLQYWKAPEYLRFLLYPQALHILDMLITNEDFRKELTLPQFAEFIHKQQGFMWMVDEKLLQHQVSEVKENDSV